MGAKLKSKMAKVKKAFHKGIVSKLEETGAVLKNTLTYNLSGEGTGNHWHTPERLAYGYSSAWYQASAPDEYPAERTGVLMNSIEYDLTFGLNMIYTLHVGTDVEYGEEVEDKRPFLTRLMIEEIDTVRYKLSKPMLI